MRKTQSQDTDHEALEDILRMFKVFDELHANSEWDRLPGCDFEIDQKSMPMFDTTFAVGLLAAAIDHFHAHRILAGEPPDGLGQWLARAPWTILRAALEISSQVIWLLEPEESDIRVERALTFIYRDYAQAILAKSHAIRQRTRVAWRKEQELQLQTRFQDNFPVQWANPTFRSLIENDISLIDCISAAARSVKIGTPDDVMRYWRAASGFAHGSVWTSRIVGTVQEMPNGGKQELYGSVGIDRIREMTLMALGSIRFASYLARKRSGYDVTWDPIMTIPP